MMFCYAKFYPTTDISVPESNCSNGELRLAGSIVEGRVEICLNDAWGTICDNSFGSAEARVVCHQLGFDREGMYTNQSTINIIDALISEKLQSF